MRVLVVDDSLDMLTLLRLALQLDGYAVDTAATGAQALELASVHAYDVTLLDLNLPDGDGLLVCRQLRAADTRVRILVLSGRTAVETRVAALDAGADDYVPKPFDYVEVALHPVVGWHAVDRPARERRHELQRLVFAGGRVGLLKVEVKHFSDQMALREPNVEERLALVGERRARRYGERMCSDLKGSAMEEPQPNTPEAHYAALVATLGSLPHVTHAASTPTPSRGFGASSLKSHNKIFAMLVKGRLVVKLPRQRVDALIAAGVGERFDPGHGRLMKEWVAIAPADDDTWLQLAQEALAFVSNGAKQAQEKA